MAPRSNGKAGERLALVDETQADRQTIEIYELVTRKMRIGRVPLIFKALAAEKALVPCWTALRPAIRVRAFEEAADDLRARAATAAVDLGCPLIETQLEWAGYDVDEIDEIRGQVDIFHYADAKLLMMAAVLVEALDGGVGGAKRGARAEQRVPRGVPQDMDHIELVPEDANGNLGKTFRSIRAHLGLGLVPDDFRALGRWPKYLELAWADARKRDADSRAQRALKELAAQADEAATQLPVRVEVLDAALRAAGADPGRVRTLIDRFHRAMPGLVLDLALFKVQLDGAESARESPFPVRWKYISADDYTTVGLDEQVKLREGDPKSLDLDLEEGADDFGP
ncbi:MAG: halocarboxylic acid dehydrogenase DehI family protein [Myxococcales bacterium]|nr:halocarboxylic acid dehydrogenase DehI family protein [Myxococcales bacterium]